MAQNKLFWDSEWKIENALIKACLHGDGGPQAGVGTRLGGVTHLFI